MARGTLIVIEGGDGAGKATQTELLQERLLQNGVSVQTLDFPRYTTNTYGALIRECLDGQHGDFLQLDPRIAATLYAVDRFESRTQLQEWLAAGHTVVLDRYVTANLIHQGAKITDVAVRAEFYDWLEHVEYELFQMPRPDMVVYLRLPVAQRLSLLQEESADSGIAGDMAETNQAHQASVEEPAEELARSRPDWYPILCAEAGVMRSREAIHEDVYTLVKQTISSS